MSFAKMYPKQTLLEFVNNKYKQCHNSLLYHTVKLMKAKPNQKSSSAQIQKKAIKSLLLLSCQKIHPQLAERKT